MAKSGNNIKLKGCFEIDKDPHKNHSQRVVAIAAVRELLYDIPHKETIKNHMSVTEYPELLTKQSGFKDLQPIKAYGLYDFCKEVRAKGQGKKGKSKLYLDTIGQKREKIQKVNRYYLSPDGRSRIVKKYEDGSEQLVEAKCGYSMILSNQMEKPKRILYKYYNEEAKKLVEAVKQTKNQLSLW